MRKTVPLLLIAVLYSLALSCQTYITNVNVVDVVNNKIIPLQTVVVKNGVIRAIKPSDKIPVSTSATIIKGDGKYLMPGLTDAHVHFFQSGGLYTRPDGIDLSKYYSYKNEIAWVHNNMENFLRRYVSLGITTVVDVGATYNFLTQRNLYTNKTFAPKVYLTGPLLTSWEPDVFKNLKNDEPFKLVSTIEDGKRLVNEQLPFKPDFIKIWYIVKPDSIEQSAKQFEPVLKAIIDESHKNNFKVAVHATERITAQLAVQNGCDYLVHEIEDEVVPDEFIQLLKTKKTILCPTLIVSDLYDKTFGQKTDFNLYDFIKSDPQQIGSLYDLEHLPDSSIEKYKKFVNSSFMIARSNRSDSIRMVNLKKMVDAGVTIVTGTDAGNIGTQHASSYISELKAMRKSGLTNWQIIQSATLNAANIFNTVNSTGSITTGKVADMLLLDANPIEDIENLTKINMVFNKGHAIKPDTLIPQSPLALVQRQVNGYNAGNIDAFLEPYSDSVEIFSFPNTLIIKGKENMRKEYSTMFHNLPNLHCEIKERFLQGNIIIDKESVSGIKQSKSEGIAIYQIENNKIRKIYLVE